MKTNEAYIVDDSADHRFLLKKLFSRYLPESNVTYFEGAKALLTHLSTPGSGDNDLPVPSFILMDLSMPEIDGLQALRLLKQPASEHMHWKEIPVILTSSGADHDVIKKCYAVGANSFIVKPVEFDNLKEYLLSVWHFWNDINYVPAINGNS